MPQIPMEICALNLAIIGPDLPFRLIKGMGCGSEDPGGGRLGSRMHISGNNLLTWLQVALFARNASGHVRHKMALTFERVLEYGFFLYAESHGPSSMAEEIGSESVTELVNCDSLIC